MGTNYYIKTGRKIKRTCPTCNHTHLEEEKYHIGKSSWGRYFTLHVDREHHLTDLKTWLAFLKKALRKPKSGIFDEYGEAVTLEDMVHCITRDRYFPERADKNVAPGTPAKWGDIYGEQNLVYSQGAKVGEDGLYVMLEGEFS